jgi:hypothetical protein
MKRRIKQYRIYKISTDRLVKHEGKIPKIVPITLTEREALERQELVAIQSNQLTNKIFNLLNLQQESSVELLDKIVNVVVPTDAKKQGEKDYATIAKNGFELNGKKYVRLFSGSGQIRRNTVTFIRQDLYAPIYSSLLCGLTDDDFGKEFNAAKFNAYCGLNMSGCYLLPGQLSPNVCVVDDFEQIRPHSTVNHVTERQVQYITLPDEDYILEEGQTDYLIENGKAIRISDGVSFTIRKGVKKQIQTALYDEIEDSPALNSFDGQGLMSPVWAERVAQNLGLDYTPAALIIRAPWVKGLLANIPFHEWFYERGIYEIQDSFGKIHSIDDIDVIISKSQFKMHKVYKAKCEALGVNVWDYYVDQMKKNNLLWGVVKANNAVDDDYKALNYQYLQALQLSNAEVDKLCELTETFLREINSGDLETVYNYLMVNGKSYSADSPDDENDVAEDDGATYKKLFQRVLEANPAFLEDKYIRSLILKECESKLNAAKLGKVLVRGNFQFCISDPVAQLQWIAKNHCGVNMDVRGIVGAGEVYSNYWLDSGETQEIVLMRSPLIDRNEIAKRRLIQTRQHYFRYLGSGVVYSIHDLTALQQGGCDFDGDITFSTNEPIIRNGCYDYSTAKPLYYALSTTDLVGRIIPINIIKADKRGLNSKVGKISNKGGSLYAMLELYSPDSPEYQKIYDSIVALGQVVGMEIDRIKTAVAPTNPLEWTPIQITRQQSADFETVETGSDAEREGIDRHNAICPILKPYYFRYNYDYIEKSIRDLDRVFNKLCRHTWNMRLNELADLCKSGQANEEQQKVYSQYLRAYPVIDTNCVVNRICHRFEVFDTQLKRDTLAEGENLLSNYVSCREFDSALISKVTGIVNEYKRAKRFLVKRMCAENKDSAKVKGHKTHETQILLANHYRDLLLELVNDDLQLCFDILVAVADVKTVWDLLDMQIVQVIRRHDT